MSVIFIGFIFYLVPPLLTFSLVLMWKNPENWRKLLWMYVSFLGLLAFSYAPKPDSGDLVRYFSRLNIYGQMTLSEVISRFQYREVGENIWIWIAAKLDSPGLLPGVATLIVYGVASYITCDYAERVEKTEYIKWILLFQLLIIPFNNIANNIFNVSAFALVLLAAYREIVQKKRNLITLALYIIPCFIQQAAIIIIIARVLAILANKYRYIAIGIVFAIPSLLNFFYTRIASFSGIPMLYSLINRGNYYLNETTDSAYAIKIRTTLWYRINFVICMGFAVLAIVVILGILRRKGEEMEKGENRFLSFLFLVSILTIGCIPLSAPHYWRFILVVQMAMSVIICSVKIERNVLLFKHVFIILTIMQFANQLYQMLRSAVILNEWMLNFLFSSPFQLIYKLFRILLNA